VKSWPTSWATPSSTQIVQELCREQAELEAESIAYIVCAGLGIDTSEYSFGYLAVWAGGGEQARHGIAESAQRIQTAAHRVLDALTPGAEEVAA